MLERRNPVRALTAVAEARREGYWRIGARWDEQVGRQQKLYTAQLRFCRASECNPGQRLSLTSHLDVYSNDGHPSQPRRNRN